MSTKAIGTQELVFVKIIRAEPGKNSVALHVEHASTGTTMIHRISNDKLKHQNCYRDLEVGNTYVIVQILVSPMRWVWTKCRLCTKTQARTFFNKTGISPSAEAMADAMTWLNSVQRGIKPAETLIDQLATW